MKREDRIALRAQVASKKWECTAEMLISLLDALDQAEDQIAVLHDTIHRMAAQSGGKPRIKPK